LGVRQNFGVYFVVPNTNFFEPSNRGDINKNPMKEDKNENV